MATADRGWKTQRKLNRVRYSCAATFRVVRLYKNHPMSLVLRQGRNFGCHYWLATEHGQQELPERRAVAFCSSQQCKKLRCIKREPFALTKHYFRDPARPN
jgi:hypothetical protein